MGLLLEVDIWLVAILLKMGCFFTSVVCSHFKKKWVVLTLISCFSTSLENSISRPFSLILTNVLENLITVGIQSRQWVSMMQKR